MILYQDKIKYILFSLAIILAVAVGIFVWRLNREIVQKNETPASTVETAPEVTEKPSTSDREIVDSLSVLQSKGTVNNNTITPQPAGTTVTVPKKSDQEVLQSLSAKQNSSPTSKQSDAKMLNSLLVTK